MTDSDIQISDRPADTIEAEMSRILRDAELNGELYSGIVESLLNMIFRQPVKWFVEEKAKRHDDLNAFKAGT